MTTDDDERLTVLFDTPSIYAPLAEWIEYRRWLVAEFGDRPIGKPYIQTADECIRYISDRGDPFADVQ